ncbi:hypothetical protein C8R46DRAFT_1358245 [Mycena filopes]|nr:hypothetical protein C8R46DRAFT_1358245 [Mycena filopes]
MLSANVLLSLAVALAASATHTTQNTGQVFYFTPGLGACGYTNTTADHVGTVSNTTFKGYPGATANPNKNPICGRTMVITAPNNISINVTVVDFFKQDDNAGAMDVGVTKGDFSKMEPVSDGVIPGAKWEIM